MKKQQSQKIKLLALRLSLAVSGALLLAGFVAAPAYAAKCGQDGGKDIETTIDLGCKNNGTNPVQQLFLAILRFLGAGVGIAIIGSGVVAGIQYAASRGDPQATANAKKRILSTVIALAFYLLAFSLLQWLLPGGLY